MAREAREGAPSLWSYFAARSSRRLFVNLSAFSARLRHRSACSFINELSIALLNALASGASLTAVANAFANSSESLALYPFLSVPNLVNASTFVTQVYNNLLNRAPDAPGLAFWTTELQSGAVTPGSFILTVEASVNMQTGTADALTLAAKGTVAEDYVLRIAAANAPFSQASAHAALAPVSGIGKARSLSP
jgi:hypothetical protein